MSPTDDAASAHTVDTPYQLFMLALCVWALAVLAAGSFAKWDESTRSILEYADLAICLMFFVDFVVTLTKTEHKLRYFGHAGMDRFAVEHSNNRRPPLGTCSPSHADSSSSSRRQVGTRADSLRHRTSHRECRARVAAHRSATAGCQQHRRPRVRGPGWRQHRVGAGCHVVVDFHYDDCRIWGPVSNHGRRAHRRGVPDGGGGRTVRDSVRRCCVVVPLSGG